MGRGSGFGKVILFGEHFVVYGFPAIAAAVGSTTIATVRRISEPGWKITDNRPAVPGYKKKKLNEQKVSIDNILRFADIDVSQEGLHITLLHMVGSRQSIGSARLVAILDRSQHKLVCGGKCFEPRALHWLEQP